MYLTPDENVMAAFTPDATSTVPIGPTTWRSPSRRGRPSHFRRSSTAARLQY
jgi:hypothetical protein